MSSNASVVSVNISERKGTAKQPVAEALIDPRGIVGDAHAGPWHRQVSLLSQDSIDSFVANTGKQVGPGEFAENLTLQGVDLKAANLLDRVRIGEVLLEVTQIGKKCHGAGCSIFQDVGTCVMPTDGIFCRVIHGGAARKGDAVTYLPKTLDVVIVTLSDRASAGHYTDRSGPKAKEMVEAFLSSLRWPWRVHTAILPDEADLLRDELVRAVNREVDVVITLGGTGVGPRDIAPETVMSVCQKTVPGIMENIRAKFGADKPSALLSRSVAAIAAKTQIYALPGSPRAVEEYLSEILKTLEHMLLMMHGLDTH